MRTLIHARHQVLRLIQAGPLRAFAADHLLQRARITQVTGAVGWKGNTLHRAGAAGDCIDK